MELVNLTRHAVVLYREDGSRVEIPPSGVEARVSTRERVVGALDGVPLVVTEYGEIEYLPEPRPGVGYIVSLLVAQRAWEAGRNDVFAPNTSPGSVVRNEQGQIEGVKSLLCAPGWEG